MSSTWNQGGQPQMAQAPRRTTNPLPVCFNCNQEGHFVVDCPQPSRMNNAAFPTPPTQSQGQQIRQPHQPQGPPLPPYQAQYPQAQYSQPQNQQAQHYGPPVQQSYGQPPIPPPYHTPQATGQYGGPGYQAPVYNQFSSQSQQPQYGPNTGYQNAPQNSVPPVVPAFYNPSPSPNYQPQNNGYNGSYGPPPQPPVQQWNNGPAGPRSAPPFQRPQRGMSHGSQNGNPGPHYQQSYSQTSMQNHHQQQQSRTQQQGMQSSAQSINIQGSSSSSFTEAVGQNGAGTPHQVSDSLAGTTEMSVKSEEKIPSMELTQSNKTIEESPNPEDEEQQFDWDYKYIFKEARYPEVVALAQALAARFTVDVAPVPHIDIRSKSSVSRHARVENLKDFMKSIRETAEWSFAKEDPAYSDITTDCPLIPIDEVPQWIARRQGFNEDFEDKVSRKRGRSKEQEDAVNQIALKAGGELVEEPRSIKRQKNEEGTEKDAHMSEVVAQEDVQAPGTPYLKSPMINDSGAGGVRDSDDAWAPEPGEIGSISSPADPTEALLASLGVTGEAKPPKRVSLPPNNPPEEESNEVIEQLQIQPQGTASAGSTSMPPDQPNYSNQPSPPLMKQPGEMSQDSSQTSPQYGHSNNSQHGGDQPQHTPYQNEPYGPQRSASWSNGPPNHQGFVGPQQGNQTSYAPPVNQSYQGAPQGPPPNQQYGPQRSASYPNPQYGQPQWDNSQHQSAQYGYGGNTPQQNGQQNGQHYGQQQYNQYGQPPVEGQQPYNYQVNPPAQYGGPQHANLQYGHSAPQGLPQWNNGPQQWNNGQQHWNNGQQQYGNSPQNGPPQYHNGPSIQQQYGNAPQGPPQYANGPGMQQPYSNPQGPPQYNNGPQMPNGQFPQGQAQYNDPNPQQYGNYQQSPPQQNGPMHQNGLMQQNGPPQHNGQPMQDGWQQNGQQHSGQQLNGQYNGNSRQDEQQQNVSAYNHAPVRQDSGYMSARGSYSNGTGQSDFENGRPGQSAPAKQESQAAKSVKEKELPKTVEHGASDSEPDTPLSPTSAEILGKLQPGNMRKASGNESRRVKRPQPVVAEAYSRRW